MRLQAAAENAKAMSTRSRPRIWIDRQCSGAERGIRDNRPSLRSGRDHHQGRQSHVRATGITADLKAGGTLERAAAMANHASTHTTQLYDRRAEDVTLDEVERIGI